MKELGIVATVILALVGAPALYVQEGHAFDAGTEAGKVAIDKAFYDKLVAQNSEWTVVKEFLLEPEGSKPPMKTMGGADEAAVGRLSDCIQIVSGEYDDTTTLRKLQGALNGKFRIHRSLGFANQRKALEMRLLVTCT